MAADLHCHTKLSDGSVGIEDLIVIAQKSGIETIAITDHDCLAGTVRGQVIGKRYGVNVIPGVELSSFDNNAGKKVHILCYLADTPDRLEGLCKRTSVARKRAGQIMMLKVAARFPISTEFIISHASGSTNLYKQHIMHALMDAGYTNQIFGDLYNALFSPDSETNLLAPTKYPDVKEVIDEIHGAGAAPPVQTIPVHVSFPYTLLLIYRHGRAACAGEPEPPGRDLPPPTLPHFSSARQSDGACRDYQAQDAAHSRMPVFLSGGGYR